MAGGRLTDGTSCGTLTVTFDGSVSRDTNGRVVSWDWDLGDGTVDAGRMVTHAYAAAGTYRIRLVVHDDAGMSNLTVFRVTVGPCEPLTLAGGPANGSPGEPLVACARAQGGHGTYRFLRNGTWPDGASLDDHGCIHWTPTVADLGTACLGLAVTDGFTQASGCLTVHVAPTARRTTTTAPRTTSSAVFTSTSHAGAPTTSRARSLADDARPSPLSGWLPIAAAAAALAMAGLWMRRRLA